MSLYSRFIFLARLTIVVMGLTSCLDAGVITVPPNLHPGDKYRLAFVTSDDLDFWSINIVDYNAFVTTEANKNPALAVLGTTWAVIGSTDSTSAITNMAIFAQLPEKAQSASRGFIPSPQTIDLQHLAQSHSAGESDRSAHS